MKNFKLILCILSLGLFLMSCSSSSEPEIIPPGGDSNPDDGSNNGSSAKTTYEKDVKTIINNSCATSSCHDSTNPASGLRLTTYAEVKSAAQNRGMIERMNNANNPMPASGRLSSDTRAIIDKWKTDGFLEN